MSPRLSVITVNLNNRAGLQKTVDSVITQTFADKEFIIIDGGSSDGSQEIITANKDTIKYWVSEPDLGIYHAMNKGIRQAQGNYCLFLNSGDWLVDSTVLQTAFAGNRQEDILYFDSYLYYTDRKIDMLTYPATLSMCYFYASTLGHQATLIKRQLFTYFGYYNETYRIYADFDFWLKTIIAGDCSTCHISFALSYYDMQGISSKNTVESKKERQSILTNYLPAHILTDYAHWRKWEQEMPVLMWYKNSRFLYTVLVFIYKVMKNVRRVFKTNNDVNKAV